MESNKLVVFTDCYPFGSSEPFLKNELEYLALTFTEIRIIPLSYGTSKVARQVPENVSFSQPVLNDSKSKKEIILKGIFNTSPFDGFISDLIKGKAYKAKAQLWSWGIGLLLSRALWANKDVQKVLADPEYPKLYFYWGIRSSFIVPLISQYFSKTICVRFHGSDIYEETNGGYIPNREKQLRCITKAYFCSEYGMSYIAKRYPFMSYHSELSRLGVLDNGLSKESNDGIFRIVTVSNMVPLKRLELLAAALSEMSGQIEWTHIGDGETKDAVNAIIGRFPANVRAILKGRLTNEQVIEQLKASPVDLFINVSSSEGVPVSIMEALSMGIPVLATAVGGTPEIVDSKVGLLVKPDITASELKESIEATIDRFKSENLRMNARTRWSESCNAEALYLHFSRSVLNL